MRAALKTMMLGALMAAAAGCGGSDGPGDNGTLVTLTYADVAGMAAGNATGQALSGAFTLRDAHIDACRCRSGSCSGFQTRSGVTRLVEQHDGAITLDPGGGNACTGGVDADGTFSCGYSWTRGGGSELSRQHGAFTLKNGAPQSLHLVAEMTWAIPGSQSVDCDVQLSNDLDYVGPLPSP